MGCFFACFRIKDGQRSPLSSETTPCKSTDRLVTRNQLASLLLSEEEGSQCEVDTGQDTPDRELKHEAKFLKACGSPFETPLEIRNKSKKSIVQAQEQDEQPDTNSKKLEWDEKTDHISNSTTSTPNDFLPEDKHHNCMSVTEQAATTCTSSVHSAMYEPQSAAVKSGVNESVWLKVTEDVSHCKSMFGYSSKDLSPQTARQIHPLVAKDSPYSTPLKLADGVETPGTLYPPNVEKFGFGINNRIRSQYAYPIQNCVINIPQAVGVSKVSHRPGQSGELFQLQVTSAKSSNNRLELQHSLSSTSADSGFSQSHKDLLTYRHLNDEAFSVDTVCGKACNKPIEDSLDDLQSGDIQKMGVSPGSMTPMISSLSHCLKPSNSDEKRVTREVILKERSPAGKIPEADRPIIGVVAAHWNGEETTCISPKMWDGNGIPNSTNKYKEDQRVSWHATPFEERLEKALSDEKLYPQRRLLNGKPIKFEEEDEERDTAAS